ncbi:MAG TPA: T9SS type A sorting domain-containing protein [Bacteroidia bacterium]|nr:T9SS type A sorting domain-containing protein [Bacteroidia bacterium]
MMKKITTLFLMSLLSAGTLLAQSNLNFENWSGNEPTGWTSSNSLTSASGGAQTVFQVTSNTGQGSSSVRMVTGNCPDCPNFAIFGPFGPPTPLPNPMGGGIQLGSMMSPGIPYTQRPISVDFKYKSNPQGNDACGFQVELTRWNAALGETETVGEGYFEANTVVSNWTNMNIPISYSSTATPDTINIFATSSIGSIPDLSSFGLPSPSSLGLPTPVAGSEFFLDAIVFNLPSCAGFTITASGTNETSLGAMDGTATVTTQGGTAPFTYQWSNLATTQSISNLIPGCYSVTVTDNNQCQKVATYCVTPGGCNIQVSVSGTNSSSNSIYSGTGSASATVTGGNAPYTYLWNTGASTASISNLAVGTYAVLVTEQNNPACSVWGYHTVFGPNGNINGIEKAKQENVFVTYPNPSNGKFIFENKLNNTQALNLEIYSITGDRVYSQNNIKGLAITPIDLSNLSKGVYVIKVNDSKNVYTQEIVIE